MDFRGFSTFCPLRDGFICHILSMGLETDLFIFENPGILSTPGWLYIYMYIFLYLYLCIYTDIRMYIYTYGSAHLYVYIYIYICLHMYLACVIDHDLSLFFSEDSDTLQLTPR